MFKVLLLVITAFSFRSHAGLLIEPIVAYNVTAVEYQVGGTTLGTAASGIMMGGRLGFTILDTFFIAADYTSGDLEWEPEGSISQKIEGTQTRTGITAGIDVPIAPIRLWAGYYEMEFDPSGFGTSFEFEDGDGIKVGIGLTFLPIIDINIEYYSGEYDTYRLNGSLVNEKAEDTGLTLSLSAPFSL